MPCKHKYKTVNTVSRSVHKQGSKKFKSGFEEADTYGIKILVARQQQCLKCEKKRTTIELSKSQFNDIISNLPSKLDIEENNSGLSSLEKRVRNYLVSVSRGEIETRHDNKATYKEVWNCFYPARQFGRGNTNEIVEWIVHISNYDTENGRPPLNSLVVRGDTGMPGGSWDEWREDSSTPFDNAEEAQQACWNYWQ